MLVANDIPLRTQDLSVLILKCHTFQILKHVLTNGWIGREQIKEKHMHTSLQSLAYRVTCHNLTFPLNRPGLCKPDEIRHVNAALPHRPAAQYGEVSGVKQGMVGKSGQLRVSSNMSNFLCISSLKTSHSPLWRSDPKSNVLVYITVSGACFIGKFIKFHHSICHSVIDIITTLNRAFKSGRQSEQHNYQYTSASLWASACTHTHTHQI